MLIVLDYSNLKYGYELSSYLIVYFNLLFLLEEQIDLKTSLWKWYHITTQNNGLLFSIYNKKSETTTFSALPDHNPPFNCNWLFLLQSNVSPTAFYLLASIYNLPWSIIDYLTLLFGLSFFLYLALNFFLSICHSFFLSLSLSRSIFWYFSAPLIMKLRFIGWYFPESSDKVCVCERERERVCVCEREIKCVFECVVREKDSFVELINPVEIGFWNSTSKKYYPNKKVYFTSTLAQNIFWLKFFRQLRRLTFRSFKKRISPISKRIYSSKLTVFWKVLNAKGFILVN